MTDLREQQREEWGIGEEKAMRYLVDRGFMLTFNFAWLPPRSGVITEKDHRAIAFLVEERGFQGLLW